ncbi:MAG: FHA domain-containing protein, partial [Muribaculaceae bacterium]|nr:FHA domain-containing protein [Muribaculaceae bacterium]
LKGKTIYIGRDPKVSNLLVAVKEDGTATSAGNPGCVPYSVSRCIMSEGKAHARIEIDGEGAMTLYSMNSANSTFVDGVEVSVCRITPKSNVELGRDRFRIKLQTIFDMIRQNAAAKAIDISHLKEVWENYEAEMDHIVISQQEMGKKRMLPIMVSSASGILSGVGALVSLSTLWVTLPVTGVVSYLYFRNYNTKDTSYEDRRKANNEFQQRYVCPSCGHFFGMQSYELLKNQLRNPKDKKMYCPKCKCQLEEKH